MIARREIFKTFYHQCIPFDRLLLRKELRNIYGYLGDRDLLCETGAQRVGPCQDDAVLHTKLEEGVPGVQTAYHLDHKITENHNQARERPCSSNIYLKDDFMDKNIIPHCVDLGNEVLVRHGHFSRLVAALLRVRHLDN